MKTLLEFLCLVYLLTLAMSVPTRYENINIDQVLNNSRLYKKYFECLANIGKCNKDGRELKEMLPEALASNCEKCDERIKQGAEKVLKFMIENKPDDFSVLEKIYDPDGAYRKKYSSEAEKRGVKFS
ncbi:ejaculatory bulb-specific protein 3 [Halyomorpha halys]|uniref:ejaculatory bulb-specific protein 3 n=1 Tax=Halyomorpha halys TaxID=286706 RepID=UPI0006D51581|nr:ejaculatory bulb-specific protein 3-like [Halyomorpha halys]XP_014292422.1 ejaculatory bulb-specific protein 3-like [Halyomorpha halys]XP_014292423.1 ejaculatory bulb-specific protein 3-like [Halyomorpha halys]